MKMKKSMTRLELSIADSTNSNKNNNEQHDLFDEFLMQPKSPNSNGILTEDEDEDDDEWSEHDQDLKFSDDDDYDEEDQLKNVSSTNLQNSPRSLLVDDYMRMDAKTLRKELFKLANPKLIKLCKQ